MLNVIQLILFLAIPFGLFALNKKLPFVKVLSPILLCYAVGILWGNIPFLPLNREWSMTIAEVMVPIAIPLILFSANFKKFVHSARNIVISFLLMIFSAFAAAFLAGLLFRGIVPEYDKIAGMLVGVYTGGTPNLMAIGMALNVRPDTLVLVNACDALLGGLYFFVIISVLKPLLSKFLKPYRQGSVKSDPKDNQTEEETVISNGRWKKSILHIGGAILLGIVALGLSVGLSLILTRRLDIAIIMLVVTTIGILGSFLRPVRNIKHSYKTGQYFILVFSIALGSIVDIQSMLTTSPAILGFTATAMFGAIVIHFILAKLARIDVDTAIITSSAGIYGPPFIGPIADALKNKDMIVPGLTCGLVGYAVGNYLGLLMYQLFLLL